MVTINNQIQPSDWYFSESTGAIVYFKRKFNKNYDAYDIITDKKIKWYQNLTFEKILEIFRPYHPEDRHAPTMEPMADHLDDCLARFQTDMVNIDNPSNLDLHNQIKQTLHQTRQNINAYKQSVK